MSFSGHRHAQITETDHGPLVNVASWILMVTSILFTSFRIVSSIFIRGRSGKDDWIVLLATIIAAAQSIATSFMVANGLGQHQQTLTDATLLRYQKVQTRRISFEDLLLMWSHRHYWPAPRCMSPRLLLASFQSWCF